MAHSKVSLRLNVKLPSAGLNGQLQRADESVIDSFHEKISPVTAQPVDRQSLSAPPYRRASYNNKKSAEQKKAVKKPLVDSDILELNNPIPDLPAERMKTMREHHLHFTRNKMMTPKSKLPTFLKPVKQRSSLSPKEKMLKKDKQQQSHQEALKAVLDLSNDMKREDENLVWKQSALQANAEKVKRQRQSIFEKFRSAPNSPSLPSFMLKNTQRSSTSPLASGGAPIRITSLRTPASGMTRMVASNDARQNAKINELVKSANNSIQTFRKTPKRSSLEKRAQMRQRLHVRAQQFSSPSIPSNSGLSLVFTGKR